MFKLKDAMNFLPYKDHHPAVDKSAYVAPNAFIIGDVQIGHAIWENRARNISPDPDLLKVFPALGREKRQISEKTNKNNQRPNPPSS